MRAKFDSTFLRDLQSRTSPLTVQVGFQFCIQHQLAEDVFPARRRRVQSFMVTNEKSDLAVFNSNEIFLVSALFRRELPEIASAKALICVQKLHGCAICALSILSCRT